MEPAEHTRKRPPLEALLQTIPGFKGYLDRENRRASDQLQRQWMAERLDRAKRSLSRLRPSPGRCRSPNQSCRSIGCGDRSTS